VQAWAVCIQQSLDVTGGREHSLFESLSSIHRCLLAIGHQLGFAVHFDTFPGPAHQQHCTHDRCVNTQHSHSEKPCAEASWIEFNVSYKEGPVPAWWLWTCDNIQQELFRAIQIN
jgi:hypothetical protein